MKKLAAVALALSLLLTGCGKNWEAYKEECIEKNVNRIVSGELTDIEYDQLEQLCEEWADTKTK